MDLYLLKGNPQETGKEMKPFGEAKVDMIVPDEEDLRISTRVHGDAESIVFETTDHEGAEVGDAFEMTWNEIYDACKEWFKEK